MADRLVRGTLAGKITEYRNAGMSYDAIARQLYVDGGVEVTGDTVRSWAKQLGIDGEAA